MLRHVNIVLCAFVSQSTVLEADVSNVEVEAIPKALEDLSEEERMAALVADAPELLALLAELKDSLAEVRHRVAPVLEQVKSVFEPWCTRVFINRKIESTLKIPVLCIAIWIQTFYTLWWRGRIAKHKV